MNWSEKHVIVTGGAGFIGSHLVDELVKRGVGSVLVIDDLSRGRIDNLNMRDDILTVGLTDIVRQGLPLEWLHDNSIVFHLAAKVTGIHYNATHQLDMMQSNLAINHAMTEWVLNGGMGLDALIWVSTACVYPHDAVVPTTENAAQVCNPEPTNFGYGVAKWVGEQQAKYLNLEYDIPTVVTRFYNAFGPRDYYDEETSHVAPALIRRVMEQNGDEPLVVWGTGQQTRVLVDARDIATALCLLAENISETSGRVVNIGHTNEISIEDLAYKIIDICGKSGSMEVDFDTSRPDGYPRRSADTTLLNELVGWIPNRSIDQTLSDMLVDYHVQVGKGWII